MVEKKVTYTRRGWRGKAADNIDVHLQCSVVETPTVYLSTDANAMINMLLQEYPRQEWAGFLVGNKTDSIITVTSLVIPPHAHASGGAAELEPGNEPEGTVGFIHSHNSMGAFHSGTDKDYVDSNYPVSITVSGANSSRKFDAKSTVQTPCGRFTSVDVEVLVLRPPVTFNTEDWLNEAKHNIAKGSYRGNYKVAGRAPAIIYPDNFQFPQGYYEGDYYVQPASASPFRTTRSSYPPTYQHRNALEDLGFSNEFINDVFDADVGEDDLLYDDRGNAITKRELAEIMGDIFGDGIEDGGIEVETEEGYYTHSNVFLTGSPGRTWHRDTPNGVFHRDSEVENKWGKNGGKEA